MGYIYQLRNLNLPASIYTFGLSSSMERSYNSLPPPIPSIALRDDKENLKGKPASNHYHEKHGSYFAEGCPFMLPCGTTVSMAVWNPKYKVIAIEESVTNGATELVF
jgi:hypothetical protein